MSAALCRAISISWECSDSDLVGMTVTLVVIRCHDVTIGTVLILRSHAEKYRYRSEGASEIVA